MTRLLLVGALLACSSACFDQEDERPATLPYITEAILVPSCTNAECHSEFAAERTDVFATVADARRSLVLNDLVVYTTTATDTRPYTDPNQGGPNLIKVLTNVNGLPDTDRMPYDSPLPDPDLELIERWIETDPNDGITGPVGAQCVPGPDDDSTQGCTLGGQLVECDAGTMGALVTDCTTKGQICQEGACVAP
jgi:hypothetical protein